MKRHAYRTVWLAATWVLAWSMGVHAAGDLSVMTYNLRYASDTPPNAWSQRLPVALAMLRKHQPDVIGTQEALYRQVKDLDAGLPDYAWIGLGRDGGSRGEFMAVFYRAKRLEPLAFDHFWLSETPEVIASTSWRTACRRMVTWVKFRDRETKRQFYFVNTHFDHRSKLAREKSAELVARRLAELPGAGTLPIVLVGDFNARAESSKPYETLTRQGGFSDAWPAAKKRGELVSTFHGYRGPRKDGSRIDWILCKGPVTVLSSEIITFAKDGQYPSDHFPVIARIVLE